MTHLRMLTPILLLAALLLLQQSTALHTSQRPLFAPHAATQATQASRLPLATTPTATITEPKNISTSEAACQLLALKIKIPLRRAVYNDTISKHLALLQDSFAEMTSSVNVLLVDIEKLKKSVRGSWDANVYENLHLLQRLTDSLEHTTTINEISVRISKIQQEFGAMDEFLEEVHVKIMDFNDVVTRTVKDGRGSIVLEYRSRVGVNIGDQSRV